MMCHNRIESYLRQHRVPFGVHRYVFEHAEASARGEHLVGQLLVHAAAFVANHNLVLLAFPKWREIDLPKVLTLIGDPELRPASADELARAFPGCAADAIPPLGDLFGIPTYVDRSLEGDRAIFFPDGTHDAMFSIGYHDYKRLTNPQVAEFTHLNKDHPINTDMLTMGGL